MLHYVTLLVAPATPILADLGSTIPLPLPPPLVGDEQWLLTPVGRRRTLWSLDKVGGGVEGSSWGLFQEPVNHVVVERQGLKTGRKCEEKGAKLFSPPSRVSSGLNFTNHPPRGGVSECPGVLEAGPVGLKNPGITPPWVGQ